VAVVCPDEANREIIGYPNEFKQVILNLLGNAHDAILESRNQPGPKKKGVITFTVSNPSENELFIDVRDNGVGIPPEAVPRIFDPSFTTKEKSGGSGIGLYMSRMIIQESMKGRLTLLDDVQETVFRIEMPLEGES
jgi:signal transduction histidine kinase